MNLAKASNIKLGKCSLCGTERAEHEFNGVNPTAPVELRYKRAFCIHIEGCNNRVTQSLSPGRGSVTHGVLTFL